MTRGKGRRGSRPRACSLQCSCSWRAAATTGPATTAGGGDDDRADLRRDDDGSGNDHGPGRLRRQRPRRLGRRRRQHPGSSALALQTDVRLGRHEGHDRVVLELRPGSRPGYRVRYVRPPVIQDASGTEIQVDGEAFLAVPMEPPPASTSPETPARLHGPDAGPGSSAGPELVLEVFRTGDFEAVLSWVAGLAERSPFRVQSFSRPPPDRRRRPDRRVRTSRGRGR
jgi:hypothetical protein